MTKLRATFQLIITKNVVPLSKLYIVMQSLVYLGLSIYIIASLSNLAKFQPTILLWGWK